MAKTLTTGQKRLVKQIRALSALTPAEKRGYIAAFVHQCLFCNTTQTSLLIAMFSWPDTPNGYAYWWRLDDLLQGLPDRG